MKAGRQHCWLPRSRLRLDFAGGALSQSADDLKNDEKTPGDVLVYGMGYSGQRYSPLTQINKDNVASSSRSGAMR